MKSSNHEFELYVLVDGKTIREYNHDQATFVEGRDGSDYTIRVRNGTSARASFVLSVDGLSVLDGKECGDGSPGYVLSAGETLDVIAYKVDDVTGAKFVFGTKDNSYSSQIGRGTDNIGVIAARVFREKPLYSVNPGWSYTRWQATPPHPTVHGGWSYNGLVGLQCSGSPLRSMAVGSSTSDNNISTNISTNISSNNIGTNTSAVIANSLGGNNRADVEIKTSGGITNTTVTDEALGTVFGDAVDWQTTQVAFEKASILPDASLVVYYDTRINLEKRGIKFRTEPAPLPNPFPGNGCPIPVNWRK
jgi:hypothetical protein